MWISSFGGIEVISVTCVTPNDYSGQHEHIVHESFEDVQELHVEDTVVWDPDDDLCSAAAANEAGISGL